MKVIDKYILKNFFRYLIACLAVLVFIYVIINLFENLGKYLAKNAAAIDIIVFYLYHIPSYIVLLVPIASIMAVQADAVEFVRLHLRKQGKGVLIMLNELFEVGSTEGACQGKQVDSLKKAGLAAGVSSLKDVETRRGCKRD